MVSAFASSWPSPPELETPRKKEESLKALKALVRDWDLLEKKAGVRTGVSIGRLGRWVMCTEAKMSARKFTLESKLEM